MLSLAIWLIAEDLGEIATGTATDCNSGPLLAVCYWPLRSQRVGSIAHEPAERQ